MGFYIIMQNNTIITKMYRNIVKNCTVKWMKLEESWWYNNYSGKILLSGQLWGSVRILPPDKIKFFLDIVNHYAVNFDLKRIKSHYYGNLEGYQATLSGAKSKMNTSLNGHNCDFFLYESLDLSDLSYPNGKEREICIQRQSQKIKLKVFENLKKKIQ